MDVKKCPECGQPISEAEYNRQCAAQVRRDEEELERINRTIIKQWEARAK